MGTAKAMLAEAAKSVGTHGRPNVITRDYAARHGSAFLRAAWCDMAITWWSRRSDNTKAVLPNGDRAYTVWHAGDFVKLKRFFEGTQNNIIKYARPGHIVFFDWGGSNTTGFIDHVGIITANLGGGRVATIEGNTGDACRRRVRAANVIAGFGVPAYDTASEPATEPAKGTSAPTVPAGFPLLRRGASGKRVRQLQTALRYVGQALTRHGVDGDYGPETELAVRAFQRARTRLAVDGIYGPRTADALTTAVRERSQ